MLRTRVVAVALALLPAVALAAPSAQAKALHQQIAALELDRTLNLTTQQAQVVLPKIQDMRAKVQSMKSQMASSEPARIAALTQAVADLKSSGAISDSTAAALKAARPTTLGTERQDLKSILQQIKAVLTPDQIQAVKTMRLGVAAPVPGDAPMSGHRAGGMAKRMRMLHALLSDDFLALVQARAS
jgi:hypothetical protein